jgi:hypothetical protein
VKFSNRSTAYALTLARFIHSQGITHHIAMTLNGAHFATLAHCANKFSNARLPVTVPPAETRTAVINYLKELERNYERIA